MPNVDWVSVVWLLMALVLVATGLSRFNRQNTGPHWLVQAALWLGIFAGVMFIASVLGIWSR